MKTNPNLGQAHTFRDKTCLKPSHDQGKWCYSISKEPCTYFQTLKRTETGS